MSNSLITPFCSFIREMNSASRTLFASFAAMDSATESYVTDTAGDGTTDSDIGLTTDVPFARYDRGLLTIENRAAQNEVTVFKHWNCQDTEREDVIVQLLANGSANDAADILKSSGQSATQTLTAVHGWSHTWTDVPDYSSPKGISSFFSKEDILLRRYSENLSTISRASSGDRLHR